MIVKFLAKSSTFKGVRYNTNKVEKNKGELMKVSGFGPLQGLSHLMPQDYINYLKLVSARNKRVIYPQLHTVISAKGKDTSKEELTEIAEKWLHQMGYADQPYLIIFHKDTRNHHVHLVSTRVSKSTGQKINSAFEKIRAMTAINMVMKLDEKQVAKNDLDKAMGYNFQTKAQFMMILESKGYTLLEEKGKLQLIKFGRNLLEVDLAFLNERKANYEVNQDRASQITAFFHKYRLQYSAVLRSEKVPMPGGFGKAVETYTSDLAEHLKHSFGIQLLFHGSPGKAPYGYSVLDHARGNVFKGGEIMDLQDMLAEQLFVNEVTVSKHEERGIDFERTPLLSSEAHQFIQSAPHQVFESSTQQSNVEPAFEPFERTIQISISDDIDDEAIHGRNRQRKKQARTNTR